MFDYAETAQTALELIREFGKQITLRTVAGAYDPASGVFTSANSDSTLDVVFIPASKGTIEAFDDRLKGEYMRGNVRFLLAAASSASAVPKPADVLIFDSETWSVMGVTPLKPAETAVIYKIGCTRAPSA